MALLACGATVGSACATTMPPASAPPTIALPVPAVTGVATITHRVANPARASTIQLCLDVSPEAVALDLDASVRALSSVADAIEAAFISIDADGGRDGLVVQAWTAGGPGETNGLLFDSVIPDYSEVPSLTGLQGQALAQHQRLQADERERAASAQVARSDLLAGIRSATIAPTASADLLGCVSRANTQMGAFPDERRLLIIVSPLGIPSVTPTVRGDLSTTYQVLVLGFGPDLEVRRQAWQGSWISLGAAGNLSVHQIDDGLASPLTESINRLLGVST